MGVFTKLLLIAIVLFAVWIGFQIREPHFDPSTLAGKRVLVTGASSGIGEQAAYHYAQHGASVVITARREDLLKQVVEKCKKIASSKTTTFHYIPADFSKPETSDKVIKFAMEKLGGLDHLILNHAYLHKFDIWTGHRDNLTMLHKMMDVNFRAFVHLASHALPALSRSKGSIAIVSSSAGKYSVPFMTAYSASKHALMGFFGGMRNDLRMADPPVDVSITICTLGLIGTDAGRNLFEPVGLGYIIDLVGSETPEGAAWSIIKGTSLRRREIIYPRFKQMLELMPFLRELIPESMDEYLVKIFQGAYQP